MVTAASVESFLVGTWLSLVEHSFGVRGVGSSNLPVPTNKLKVCFHNLRTHPSATFELQSLKSVCTGFVNNQGGRAVARSYSDVWNSMFSSTESCAGVPEVLSPERIATTRKPLELVWTS